MRSIAPLLLALAGSVGGCTVEDPLYCDRSRPCDDPDRPFCDLDGVYPASEGIKRTCIPEPDVTEPPMVDFALSATDGELEVHVGEDLAMEVTVVRAEGFNGPISVRADGLPMGITVAPVTVEDGVEAATLVLSARDAQPGSFADITLVGSAGAVERTAAVNLAVLGPSGSLDLSFGILGFATEPGSGTDDARFVTELPDGELLVAGNARVNSNVTFMTERFSRDGELDETYGKDGLAGFDLFGLGPQGALRFAVQEPGKVIVALGSTPSGLALGRFDGNGHFDPTFAGNGSFMMPAVYPVQAAALAVGPRREIIAAMTEDIGQDRILLARFSADGVRDEAFGDGLVSIDLGDLHAVDELVVLADGGVAVLMNATNEDAVAVTYLVRVTAQGALDQSFDDDGVLEWEDAANPGAIWALEDGQILVGGSRDARPTLWRLQSDGDFDPAFGPGGERQILPEGREGGMRQFFEDSGGRLMAASGGEAEASIIRLNDRLEGVDTSFGDGGMSKVPLPAPLFFQRATSVGRGRLVVIADEDSYSFALGRIFE